MKTTDEVYDNLLFILKMYFEYKKSASLHYQYFLS